MKHIFNYILPILLLIISSCSHDADGYTPDKKDTDSISVTLNIQVPGQNTPTTYSIDDIAENYIEAIDVLAFIIDEDDESEKFSYHSTGDLTVDVGAEKTFKVTLLRSKEKYRFIVITNARQQIRELGNIEKGTLKEDILDRLIFRNPSKWDATSTSQFTPFPMWGESEPTIISSDSEVIDNMKLIRMTARIDVALTTDEAKEVFQLESVYIFNRKTRGHVVPNTTAEYWGTDNISSHEKALKATMPEDNIAEDPLTITESVSYIKEPGANVTFYQDIYTFEADAPASGEAHEATCLVIGGIYEDDEKPTYYRIDFFESDKRTYKDILRNHLYKVNIVKVDGSGHSTPEEAFDAKSINMEVDIVMWDQGEMKDIVFDGQYILTVSQSEFTFSNSESHGELKVYTDYPKGWQASVYKNATWINAISPEAGAVNEITTLSFNVDRNDTEFTRTGNIQITAGRINYLIKIIQTPDEDFNLLVTDEYHEPVTELIFPSKNHLQFAKMQQLLNVEWDPSEMACVITEVDVLNHLDLEITDNLTSNLFSQSDINGRNIIGGFYQLYVEPEEMTDEELTQNPFLEKVSRMDFTVHHTESSESSFKVESVFLHQINYTVLTDEAETYSMDGDDYSFFAKSNTGWTVSVANDPDNIIEKLYTTSGAKNTTTGEPVRFKMANNSLMSSTATLRFSSPEGRFDDINVEINGLNMLAEAQGEANCYMLKPNSSTISIPVSRANADGRTRINPGDVLQAELLWTDNANGVSNSGVVAGYSIMGSGPEGDLIVTPGRAQGNAVIAVKVNGEIKWSWHIWVTDYDGATYTGNAGAKFMDRNLGAKAVLPGNDASAAVVGVYYQFGRKDPFPGPVSFTSATETPIYNERGERVNITTQAVNVVDNIDNGIMNPMRFYTGIAISSYDWSTSSGNQSTRNDYLWETQSGAPTVYDPCPYGWQLPRAYTSGNSPWYGLSWSNFWNASEYGATWRGDSWDTNPRILGYWAASGYRDGTTGAIIQSGDTGLGKAGFYWAGNVNSWEGRTFSFRSTSYDAHTNARKSRGQTVRCIKIE